MTYSQAKNQLILQAAKQHIPLVGEFELTPQCNLSCTMCYVREAKPQKLLSTKEWLRIIREAKEAGMLFCLFTGGEIFLRSDFQELYETTYDLGIRITLFTNGTLITDKVVQMLKRRPPEVIAITMYGVNSAMYQVITGHAEGFLQVEAGIKKLQDAKIPLIVRTIAIREIYQNLDLVLDYFKTHHFSVSYSLYVGPRRCDLVNHPTNRLTPEELIDYDQRFQTTYGIKTTLNRDECYMGLSCVAGKSSFFVSWEGMMMPCAMLTSPRVKISDFDSTWKEFQLETAKIPLCDEYSNCPVKQTCMQCAAKRYLEGGFTSCNTYLKELATLMRSHHENI